MGRAAASLWPAAASRQDKARKVRLQRWIMASAAGLHNTRSHFTLACERNEGQPIPSPPAPALRATAFDLPERRWNDLLSEPLFFFFFLFSFTVNQAQTIPSLCPHFWSRSAGAAAPSPEFKARARDGVSRTREGGRRSASEKQSRIFGMTTSSLTGKYN